MISLRSISKSYRSAEEEINILHNINLDIKQNEFLSIMGPSGSGKTTLLNILGCLNKPSSGHIYINNEDITNYNNNQLSWVRKDKIGFIFQNFNLLPRLSVLDNVILPLIYKRIKKRKRKILALNALDRVGLGGMEKKYPTQLSGGQKQRVAIARALVTEPHYLIADEPTGSLDSINTTIIMDLLMSIHRKGTTIILVTHEEDVANYATRRITLVDGQILFDSKNKE
ncbi:ABC transporter ATP-binding protein [Bacillus safensis FO-36b]|nr:ABC transporter ATP-binding protein [Bacillus safensis]AWI35378.1 macrolide ABC transporter ATP-binding protein [Bacillus safensis FO-36b]KDE26383.1 ABC transporter ATP-binding protein [Bacillus safensis FO-36b]KKD40675.1 macrolide ABC transporter ATP-binding protein [Bacillus safensis]MCM3050062.1 ABC transporter ATP-binding protein [Bacillus safensis]MCM3451612.1 ABC transporter ATP-binding protein [Bacillus safensis]